MQRNATKRAAASAGNDTGSDNTAIAAVLAEYNEALNSSTVERCLAGVFMPPYSQSAVGKAAQGLSEGLRYHHTARHIHDRRDHSDVTHLDVRAHQLGWNEHSQCDWRNECRRESRAVRVQKTTAGGRLRATAFPRKVRRNPSQQTVLGPSLVGLDAGRVRPLGCC
jgi:hypothetical protein